MAVNTLKASVMALLFTACRAFVANPTGVNRKDVTRLFLEDHIADLIDQELYRQAHKKDFEREWMEKNRGAVLHSLGGSGANDDHESMALSFDDKLEDFRQHQKDLKMASDDPERYCADRCVATGNCDVFEDFYHLSPEQVLDFCEDCVLSEGEGECDLPENFYEAGKLHP